MQPSIWAGRSLWKTLRLDFVFTPMKFQVSSLAVPIVSSCSWLYPWRCDRGHLQALLGCFEAPSQLLRCFRQDPRLAVNSTFALLTYLQFLSFGLPAPFYDSQFLIYVFQFLIGVLRLLVLYLWFIPCALPHLSTMRPPLLSISQLLTTVSLSTLYVMQ